MWRSSGESAAAIVAGREARCGKHRTVPVETAGPSGKAAKSVRVGKAAMADPVPRDAKVALRVRGVARAVARERVASSEADARAVAALACLAVLAPAVADGVAPSAATFVRPCCSSSPTRRCTATRSCRP
jgi:hypothetical protein